MVTFSSNDVRMLPVKLERIEGQSAVLQGTGDMSSKTLEWPSSDLPPGAKVGDTLFVSLHTAKIEEEEKFTRMRKLLEELIN